MEFSLSKGILYDSIGIVRWDIEGVSHWNFRDTGLLWNPRLFSLLGTKPLLPTPVKKNKWAFANTYFHTISDSH